MKRVASSVLATALVVTSVYCGGTDVSAAVRAKKITMNKKVVNLEVGKKFKLKVKSVTPKKGSKAVTYKTSSKKVCTVSKKGVILAKAEGSAVITVTSKSNKKAKAKVKVNVKKAAPAATATVAPVATATAAPVATATAVPGTATPKPTKKPSATPKPTPTVKPSADKKPTADYIDVMKEAYLDVADGVGVTVSGEAVTLDFTGTSYAGARWYFGTRTTTKDEEGKDVNEDKQAPLDLSDYSYMVIEGEGQVNLAKGEDGKLPENHDLKTQLLDASDHADHGGLLEIDTHDVAAKLPMSFELTGVRKDVAAFEIYSLGDKESKNAGPITITSVKIYKDKATYDKLNGSGDADPATDQGLQVATKPAIDVYSMDISKFESNDNVKATHNDDGSVTLTWEAEAADWSAIELAFDAPVDLSDYKNIIVKTKDKNDSIFCINIMDPKKKNQWGGPASVGQTYGYKANTEKSLAEILNKDYNGKDMDGGDDADYTYLTAISFQKNDEAKKVEFTVTEISFTK